MQHYFVPLDRWTQKEVTITGDDVHHIVRVMRMNIDDEFYCNRPDGKVAFCKITTIQDDTVIAQILHWSETNVEMPASITIAQAFPKGDKLDLIMQKGTELGAASFLLFEGERSIVKWDQKKVDKKLQRYNKIVKEAAEQSHRSLLPTITVLSTFAELSQVTFDHKFVAYEETTRSMTSKRLQEVFKQIQPGERVLICIGPEGGFSEKEIDLLKQHEFQCIRLGPRILRTETAGLYALASLSYHLEETE